MLADLHDLIARHVALTGSAVGERVLRSWAEAQRQFVAVVPRDFKRVIAGEAARIPFVAPMVDPVKDGARG